jgi:hypothetical protein
MTRCVHAARMALTAQSADGPVTTGNQLKGRRLPLLARFKLRRPSGVAFLVRTRVYPYTRLNVCVSDYYLSALLYSEREWESQQLAPAPENRQCLLGAVIHRATQM